MPPGVDPTVPNVARMYDYYLGGRDNYEADRDAAERILTLMPQARRWARDNRAFLGRTVRFLAESGVRQFIDIGTGLPTQENVHQVAQRVHPDARVVYVDNDAVVVAHGRALLARNGASIVIEGDMHRPRDILGHPELRALIDLGEPVAVLLLAIVHFVPDLAQARRILGELAAGLAPGSYLVVSHATPGKVGREVVAEGREVYSAAASGGITPRSPKELAALFDGLDLIGPGLTPVNHWAPDAPPYTGEVEAGFLGAVARV
ncbi:SAM-dependent methyltransferase [Bailinhaonella thermotolerans]|uniref:SAM-dependent methyltransferase n=2 Tax=Bailinhaonella thermotolerans TaxID=1070861 RepID=A0A3A4BXE7_9ACTN|nr:SAM-dependent methyltransferase [Bailinhaonella thermotolerans]